MNVIKVLPLLTVEEQDLRRFAAALEEALAHVEVHTVRTFASLGFDLGRRTLTAR